MFSLTACSDGEDLTAPPPVGQPSFSLDHQSSTLAATTSNDTAVRVLDSFPSLTLIHIVTTGSQNEYWGAINPAHQGQLNQSLTAKGFYTNGHCRAGVYVSVGLTSIGYCTGAIDPPQTDKYSIVGAAAALPGIRRPQTCGTTALTCVAPE